MFTASAFSLMRQNCPTELNELLQRLKIDYKPDWDHGDEFKIAEKLDDEINKKICALLKSDSDLAGYAKLLDMGGVEFSVSETRKERLEKILANRDKILQGAAAKTSNNNNSSDSGLSGWRIGGGVVIAIALIYLFVSAEPNKIIAGAGVVAGLASIGFGISSKKKKSTPYQPSDKLSQEEIKNVFPILEQVNKIFNAI